MTFLRYHRVHHNASNRIDAERAGPDPLRRLVLETPYDYPAGTFCPDPLEARGGAVRTNRGKDPG